LTAGSVPVIRHRWVSQ